MSIIRAGVSLAILSLLLSTACGPRVSDTGYVGSWNREGIGLVTTISIVSQGDGYLFRWGRESDDGRVHVRCNWAGECSETIDGETAATYQMRTWVEEESSLLRVECRGRRWAGSEREVDVHYVDELLVRRDGLRLVSRAIAKDGVEFEGKGHGKRVFEKFSDAVVDPPPGSGGRE